MHCAVFVLDPLFPSRSSVSVNSAICHSQENFLTQSSVQLVLASYYPLRWVYISQWRHWRYAMNNELCRFAPDL
jgi:hypothetical protein